MCPSSSLINNLKLPMTFSTFTLSTNNLFLHDFIHTSIPTEQQQRYSITLAAHRRRSPHCHISGQVLQSSAELGKLLLVTIENRQKAMMVRHALAKHPLARFPRSLHTSLCDKNAAGGSVLNRLIQTPGHRCNCAPDKSILSYNSLIIPNHIQRCT